MKAFTLEWWINNFANSLLDLDKKIEKRAEAEYEGDELMAIVPREEHIKAAHRTHWINERIINKYSNPNPTQDEIRQALSDYISEGGSYSEVARYLDVSDTTIHKFVGGGGIKYPHGRMLIKFLKL